MDLTEIAYAIATDFIVRPQLYQADDIPDAIVNLRTTYGTSANFSNLAYATDRYDRLVILLGGADGTINGKVACHTDCRSDDPGCTWDNDWDAIKSPGGDYRVALLQMRARRPLARIAGIASGTPQPQPFGWDKDNDRLFGGLHEVSNKYQSGADNCVDFGGLPNAHHGQRLLDQIPASSLESNTRC